MMKTKEILDAAQQLSLSEQVYLASQIMLLVAQKMQSSPEESILPLQSADPIIGMFSGSPDLATKSKEILHQGLNSTSGFTWKK